MKKKFPEYLPQLDVLWSECTFVFDANVLIRIYQEKEANRKKFFSVLQKVKERLWIPHQFASEFFEFQTTQVYKQKIVATRNALKGKFAQLEKDIDGACGEMPIDMKIVKEGLLKASQLLDQNFEEAAQNAPVDYSRDEIRKDIENFFDGCVGDPLPTHELLRVAEEGRVRYENKIPPGYEDAAKSINRYGDLIGWTQMIARVQELKKPVVFVTFERKRDWWKVVDGDPVMPRPELNREMRDKTEFLFGIVSFHDFIKRVAAEHDLKSKALDKAVESVKTPDVEFTVADVFGGSLQRRFLQNVVAAAPMFRQPISAFDIHPSLVPQGFSSNYFTQGIIDNAVLIQKLTAGPNLEFFLPSVKQFESKEDGGDKK
jgi:hypothetical protein